MRSASTARPLRLAAVAASVAGLSWALAAAPAVAVGQAEPGPELVFGQTAPIGGVRPGDTAKVSFSVKNNGAGPASGVALFLDGSQGLSFAEKYSNCVYEETPAQDEGPAQVNAVCDIEQTLEPGVVYTPEKPLGVTLLDRALYEHFSLTVQPDAPTFPDGTQHGGGTDPVLRLVPQDPPADPGAVYGYERLDVGITARNTADFALSGADVQGKAGDTVSAEVTFANKGPAWVANDVGSPIGVFDVGIPAGTTVTAAPEFCLPVGSDGKTLQKAAGASVYRCTTPYTYADEDSRRSYPFRLRIDKAVANATGKVAFVKGDHRWGTLPFDKNPANNTAAIVVNASGEGPGTDGGTESPGGGPAGGAQGGTQSPGPERPGTQDGALADTGTDSTLLVGGTAAAALLAAGAALLMSPRRPRRSSAR
ncbi:hypothetical protein [Streptomyces sp. AK02-01A]|uniref:hypothetical protein n=1 Tax=Streptomyces sp. AK02-01A TaxID=3028648 RepID=UPI0029AE300F|nr:hypothetical protein [Streptomyces sp. AK02-01A]MDX3854141.1 hypothetical protein [Streptomyces sp. AK02-01A]